jgi:hypothetical protein
LANLCRELLENASEDYRIPLRQAQWAKSPNNIENPAVNAYRKQRHLWSAEIKVDTHWAHSSLCLQMYEVE